MRARNGPGGMKTESRSPMMASGVATPILQRQSISAVMTMAATNPANRPASNRLVLVIRQSLKGQACHETPNLARAENDSLCSGDLWSSHYALSQDTCDDQRSLRQKAIRKNV